MVLRFGLVIIFFLVLFVYSFEWREELESSVGGADEV